MNSKIPHVAVLTVALLSAASPAFAQKYKTDIPAAVTIPDTVETRLGTLKFTDGFPDDATVQKVYDNLDSVACRRSLTAMPGASKVAQRTALRKFGPDNQTVVIFETLMDSRSLYLTANTESIYAVGWLNLKDGPVVVESPGNTLGLVDDFWFHYVTDLGIAGPDHGQGGKFLFLPPDYKGEVPSGYHVFKSNTYNNLFATRGFVVKGRSRARGRPTSRALSASTRWPRPLIRRPRISSTPRARRSTRSIRWISVSSRRSTRSSRRSPMLRQIPRRSACSPRSASRRASRSHRTPG